MRSVVIVATCGHLWHWNQSERVHQAAFAVNILVLMGSVRCHDQVLVIQMRMIVAFIWLLGCRLFALIDRMKLVSDYCSLEEFLLGPLLLLHSVSIFREIHLILVRRKTIVVHTVVDLHILATYSQCTFN